MSTQNSIHRIFWKRKSRCPVYIVTKNYDFNNGNKRTAIILSLLFLRVNGYWLTLSEKEMYNLSINVASNTDKNHEQNIANITKIFQTHLRPL
ncbi:type II toxin-antitoxin system death-on-curing family toxin [Candidatus Saccharibacteria bacterium]|nr:type II toxin-antitoxin system death-on-curing family toxin [Candidatus Saccharibacteria bacterium]